MNRKTARAAGLAGAGAFAALTVAAQTAGPAESALRLISPPDRSILSAESVSLIISGEKSSKPPNLTVNGRALAVEQLSLAVPGNQLAAPVWLSTVKLSLGKNVIRADGMPLCTLNRAAPGAAAVPNSGTRFRIHPPTRAKGCVDCHRRAGTVLSTARTPSICHTCHQEDDLPVIHRHVMDPFARCQTCHDPHGGSRKALLRDTRGNLCIRCHEAGHYKP